MKMSFEILQRSPQVAPLLVRLYDKHNLYSLAGNSDSSEAQMELTTIMVDLLSIKLSDNESELITDVLFALMKQAEQNLKIALSERLSTLDHVPLRMILSIANDEIEIADPVLRNSPVLQDMDLMYILQGKGIEHGRAIATREGLGGAMINMLADTKDFEIAVNLSENAGIQLTERAYAIISDMAKQNSNLARPLLMRRDLPQEIAGQLYDFVGEELKRNLVERFGKNAKTAIEVLDGISIEFKEHEASFGESNEALLAHAQTLYDRGELQLSGMIAALRRGQPATFMAQFAVYCTLPLDIVRNIIRQETGRGLAIACRAMNIQKADFVSIYLLTERFRKQGSLVVSHKELSRIMTMYDEINLEEAKRTIRHTHH